jgi:hypothetical protein
MNVGFLTQFDFLYDNLDALKKKYSVEENAPIIGEIPREEISEVLFGIGIFLKKSEILSGRGSI